MQLLSTRGTEPHPSVAGENPTSSSWEALSVNVSFYSISRHWPLLDSAVLGHVPSPVPSPWGQHTKDKEQPFNRWQVVLTLQVGFLTQLNTYRQNCRQQKKARRCLSEKGGHSNTDQLHRALSRIFKSQ